MSIDSNEANRLLDIVIEAQIAKRAAEMERREAEQKVEAANDVVIAAQADFDEYLRNCGRQRRDIMESAQAHMGGTS